MKKSKFTEAHIVFALKQSESGLAVSEICRKMGISEAIFYNSDFVETMGVSEILSRTIAGARRPHFNFPYLLAL
jgi:putative transposase